MQRDAAAVAAKASVPPLTAAVISECIPCLSPVFVQSQASACVKTTSQSHAIWISRKIELLLTSMAASSAALSSLKGTRCLLCIDPGAGAHSEVPLG